MQLSEVFPLPGICCYVEEAAIVARELVHLVPFASCFATINYAVTLCSVITLAAIALPRVARKSPTTARHLRDMYNVSAAIHTRATQGPVGVHTTEPHALSASRTCPLQAYLYPVQANVCYPRTIVRPLPSQTSYSWGGTLEERPSTLLVLGARTPWPASIVL